MWFLEDFRAKTLVQQEREQELMGNEVQCGNTWQESFAKFNQDTHSWKIPRCLLNEDYLEFLGTWPRWGIMQDGECWELLKLEPIISETEFGLSEKWPTPRSCSAMAAMITPESAWSKNRNPNLETIVGRFQFPTPTCHNAKEGAYPAEFTRNTPTLATHAGGKLNPTWVEWLMGWPLGWTDLKPLVMDKSHCVQQQHLES